MSATIVTWHWSCWLWRRAKPRKVRVGMVVRSASGMRGAGYDQQRDGAQQSS